MSEQYKPEKLPNLIVDETIHFVDQVLEDGILESEELRDELLRKLYTARAISNDEAVAERIKYIEERYGRTEG